MTSCSPASVRSDGTSTSRRVGGTIRANDTVSRCIDSTTGTPVRRRSDAEDIIPRRSRVAHPAATISVAPVAASMTRDAAAGYHHDETTQHGCQVTPTPAAPVGCAIPPPTTHPGSIVQLRERLSPGDPTTFAVIALIFICDKCVSNFAESLGQDRP